MNYIKTPILTSGNGSTVTLQRNLTDRTAMIDNLIELIIFTPKGSFLADPDFGFEYWNHEYANIQYRNFNYGQAMNTVRGLYKEITKTECQESIRESLATYCPDLKDPVIDISLNAATEEKMKNVFVKPKHYVTISVQGMVDNGTGTMRPYKKEIAFLMEPTLKTHSI